MRKLFGAGTLDHKESREETEATSEKVVKVRIVFSISTHSGRDKQCIHLFHAQRTARHFLRPRSSNEANCHMIISFPVEIHFQSRSNPPTGRGLPGSRANPHKSTHVKTCTSVDRIDLDLITIEMLVQTGLKYFFRLLLFQVLSIASTFFALNQFVRVPWLLHIKQSSYSHFSLAFSM